MKPAELSDAKIAMAIMESLRPREEKQLISDSRWKETFIKLKGKDKLKFLFGV